jgi:hypothetical protein
MVIDLNLKARLLRVAIPVGEVRGVFDPDNVIEGRLRRLLSSVRSGSREVLTVIGGYGMGKTHTLKYTEHIAVSLGLKTVFIQSPGRSFLDLYSKAMEALVDEIDDPSSIANPALRAALELLKSGDREDLVYVKGWLLGYSVPARVRHKLGLMGVVRGSTAVGMLVEVLQILSRRAGVILLLDELETLLNLSRTQRFSYTESLREFIDMMPPRVALIAAMTPACWDDINTLNPALARRLSGNILYLKPLRREYVRDFIRFHLGELSDIVDEDVYDYIYELSNGIQGELLRLASIVLSETEDVKGDKVDLARAKRILEEYL